MNAYTPGGRADEAMLSAVPERFDASWNGYRDEDLAAIQSQAAHFGIRNDADSIYFARSLDYVAARNIEVLRNQTGIDRLVPTSNEVPVGAESVTYRVYDAVGMARIIGSNVDDLPRVDVRAAEMSVRVQPIGVSFGYTQQELRNAAYSGSGLPTRKAALARDFVARKENALKVRGDTAYGMYGLTNHPNIPVVVPAVGNFTAPATTAEQAVDDVITLVNAVYTQSKGNFNPTVLGMPFQVRMALLRKRMSGASQTTAMAFLQQTFPNLEFVEVQELAGAGAGGTHAMVAADRNPNYYAYQQVMPFTQHPPQAQSLEMRVPCEALTAGVIVWQPLAIAMMGGL